MQSPSLTTVKLHNFQSIFKSFFVNLALLLLDVMDSSSFVSFSFANINNINLPKLVASVVLQVLVSSVVGEALILIN